ncbi:MAG: glycoside hydrolase family protein [Bauldia sp.]|nr:glycoside hydrolase family protein [Bauldia sp.]
MTAMRVSDPGLMDIISNEALVLMPYRDAKDIWTIFVGHTASAGPPNPLDYPKGVARPIAEAIAVFRRDIAKFEARVNQAIKVPIAQHEFDAAVSFDINTGGIFKASWVNLLNQGNRAAAARAIMNWVTPPVVRKRREREQRLFRDGVYSSGGHATVYPATATGAILWKQGKRIDLAPVLGLASQPDDPAIHLTRETILDAQTDLKALSVALGRPDMDPGRLDGVWGGKTSAAVLAWQKIRSDLPDTGILDPATDAALDAAADRIVFEERPEAQPPARPPSEPVVPKSPVNPAPAAGAVAGAAATGAVAVAANGGGWGLAAFLAFAAVVAAAIVFIVLRKR